VRGFSNIRLVGRENRQQSCVCLICFDCALESRYSRRANCKSLRECVGEWDRGKGYRFIARTLSMHAEMFVEGVLGFDEDADVVSACIDVQR
jgi:hypothetical protein